MKTDVKHWTLFMPSKINCIALDSNEIKWDDKLRLWPCCYYAAMAGKKGKTGDEYIDNLEENWNSLEHHPMARILQHPAFTEYWQPDNWNSDDPPKFCKANCSNDMKIISKDHETR